MAGQIGWELDGRFATEDFVEQFNKALGYVLDIAREAGCGPEDITSMTIYVTELDSYRSRLQEIGAVWKDRMGKNYPAMALVGVAGLVESRAKVEIQAVAHIPEKGA
jgi:enamine deaminase RidA (YjgF/YER057c/UK114 family)